MGTPARAGAVLLWLALAVGSLLRGLDRGVAYAVGAYLGALCFGLVLALGVRWLYRRFVARGDARWSTGLFVLAAVITPLPAIADLGESARESQAVDERPESAKDLLAVLPPRLEYRSVPRVERERIESSLREREIATEDIAVRGIWENDRAGALVIAAISDDAGRLEDFLAGFEDAGGRGAIEEIGGTEFVIGRHREGTHVAARVEGSGLLLIYATTQAQARSFARPFADG